MGAELSTICRGCWQNMHMPIPIRGPLAVPFRLAGIKISRMNPNLCTICETMFTKVKRKKQITIEATVLFADLRGYTNLSEHACADNVVDMLHGFYDDCAFAIWERDGIINKFIGDAVLAVFNFPIEGDDHARQAVLAGVEIMQRCADKKELVARDSDDEPIGIGIGIHTGVTSIGEVGTAYKDFTVIGSVVNIASRVQAAAKPGEILVTGEVYPHVADLYPGLERHDRQLKGIEHAVSTYSLMVAA